ncbi:MAG TPA: uracil-DNA glycosylase, partial [Candidatus Binatia bacterium]|nr:uracil-DNA glycosylase [Candidatus Binatia bacterium]
MPELSDGEEFATLVVSLRRHLQRRQRARITVLSASKPNEVKPTTPQEVNLLGGTVADLFADDSEALNARSLDELRAAIGDCQRCKLCSGRTNLVFGVGNPRAKLMFVGEGPGRDEDLQGEPFVGRAGQLLNDILTKGMGLKREDV